MTEQLRFTVGFRGEMTREDEEALRQAGFGVYRDAIQTGAALYGNDPSTAVELKADTSSRRWTHPIVNRHCGES